MVDIATRVYNHKWKIDPIVRSLIDTDFYKRFKRTFNLLKGWDDAKLFLKLILRQLGSALICWMIFSIESLEPEIVPLIPSLANKIVPRILYFLHAFIRQSCISLGSLKRVK